MNVFCRRNTQKQMNTDGKGVMSVKYLSFSKTISSRATLGETFATSKINEV